MHNDTKPVVEFLEQRCLLTTINFDTDGLGANTTAGQVIDDEYANLGLTIATDDPAGHPAMIFDSANPSGGDLDLGTANEDFGGPGVGAGGEAGQPGENNTAFGKVLIISEDGDSSDPDDDASGGTIYFNFDSDVEIVSLAVLDIENNVSFVRTYDAADNVLSTTMMLNLGNNSAQTLNINTDGVRRMEVFFAGSGAIPFVTFNEEQPPGGGEGKTPGFWKNHLGAWEGFSPNQTLESVFDVPDSLGMDNTTLLQALNFGGGPGVKGGAKILFRAAVAALLNSAHSGIDYDLTTAGVISQVNTALASNNRATMLDLADLLDELNNQGGGDI